MKVVVLGGDGMLGHQLMYSLAPHHELKCTLRRSKIDYATDGLFDSGNSFFDSDIRDVDRISAILDKEEPNAVINCVGIVKQRSESQERIPSIEINALAPHRIAELCGKSNIRFIHVSTDCVFDGRTGGYTEADPCNVSDIYGLTKYLGEVHSANAITLRTSIIGHELSRKTGLLEWFLAQDEVVRGFKNAIFSGLTTYELANVIDMLITQHPGASGLYHVSSEPISKYDLLGIVRDVYTRDVSVEPDETLFCDRSLNSDRFRRDFEYEPPEWVTMIQAMKADHDKRRTAG